MKGIEVKVYDATTDEQIGVFDSIATAAYEYDVSRGTIIRSNKGIPIRNNIYFRCEKSDRGYTNKAKVVIQYDAKTNTMINRFNSALEASKKTGISVSVIRNNCRGVTKTVCKKKYYFRSPDIEYKPINPEHYIQRGVRKGGIAVEVYNNDSGELVGVYNSMNEAADAIGVKSSQIYSSIHYKPTIKPKSLIKKKYYCKLHYE